MSSTALRKLSLQIPIITCLKINWRCVDSKWDFKVFLILWEAKNFASTADFPFCCSADPKQTNMTIQKPSEEAFFKIGERNRWRFITFQLFMCYGAIFYALINM